MTRTEAELALAIRHVAFEDLGSFEPVLAERGFRVRYVEATDGLRDADAELLLPLAVDGDVFHHRDEVGDRLSILDRCDRGELPVQLAILLLVQQLAAPHATRLNRLP